MQSIIINLAIVVFYICAISFLILLGMIIFGRNRARNAKKLGAVFVLGISSSVIGHYLQNQIAEEEGWPSTEEKDAHEVKRCADKAGFDNPSRWKKAFGGDSSYTSAKEADFCICDPDEWKQYTKTNFSDPEEWCEASELDRALAKPYDELPKVVRQKNNMAPYVVLSDVEVEGTNALGNVHYLGERIHKDVVRRYVRMIVDRDVQYKIKDFAEIEDDSKKVHCKNNKFYRENIGKTLEIHFYSDDDELMKIWDLSKECL